MSFCLEASADAAALWKSSWLKSENQPVHVCFHLEWVKGQSWCLRRSRFGFLTKDRCLNTTLNLILDDCRFLNEAGVGAFLTWILYSSWFCLLFKWMAPGDWQFCGSVWRCEKQLVSQAVCSFFPQLNFRKNGLFPQLFLVILAGVEVLIKLFQRR